ncbi:MAG: SDR family oxidoreductase [Acidobacteria bacterium]|nr:SDR family oxidoreductase [Acidobacteriota bacterium]
MSRRLEGKVAVITGAAGGIGSEMAKLFAAQACRVTVNDVADEAGDRVVRQIREAGGAAVYVHADISSAREVDALFERTAAEFGGLDVLVNNAICSAGDTTIADEEESVFDRTIAVCLKGPFLCTRRALPLMKQRGGGSVITISSVNALFGVGETAYTAAKGGLISMMRLVAAEYGEWKIRSNIICPGTIETANCMEYWSRFPEGFARLKAMYPLGRIGQPREVAEYALFLASGESSFVTGAVHVVDGGLLAGRRFEV